MFLLILVVALVVVAIAGTVVLVANDGYAPHPDRMWSSSLEAPAARAASIARFA